MTQLRSVKAEDGCIRHSMELRERLFLCIGAGLGVDGKERVEDCRMRRKRRGVPHQLREGILIRPGECQSRLEYLKLSLHLGLPGTVERRVADDDEDVCDVGTHVQDVVDEQQRARA